jgi:squalene synthase HpnD
VSVIADTQAESPELALDAAALAEAMRQRVAASGTSFHQAMRLLPKPRRDAMYAIYAFCREVDDIADDAPKPERIPGLDAWRREIDALYAGRPQHVVARALAEPVARYGLRRDDFLAIIDGMEMDAREDICAPSLSMLDIYCDRVASAVGRLSVRAFGADGVRADDVAFSLGRALQLTNILRDLEEDAARGRLYLPRELLEERGIASRVPAEVLAHDKLGRICRTVADMAEKHFYDADLAMADCPRAAMRPARIMGAVYHALLRRLLARGWSRPGEPVKVPKLHKIAILLRYGLI